MKPTDFWWAKERNQGHAALIATAEELKKRQTERATDYKRHVALYGNREILGLGPTTYSKARNSERLKLNICKSITDTLDAKLTKSKPKATVLTIKGDWSLQKQAERMSRYLQGQFYGLRLYKIGDMANLVASVLDDCHVKFWTEGGKICAELVFPSELITDDQECIHGEPRQIFQTRYVSREVLAYQYRDASKRAQAAIRKADASRDDARTVESDMLCVYEGWHLRSGDDADDGRHVLCIDGETLRDEDYTRDYLPFVQWYIDPPLRGYHGTGAVRQVVPNQIDINLTLQEIQDALRMSAPHVFVPRGASVVEAHINNDTWSMIEYDGPIKPEFSPTSSVSPDLFRHLADQIQRAYDTFGVSQLAAAARKPSGVDAAVAMRELDDQQSERFIKIHQRREESYMRCAEIILDLSEELSKEEKIDLEALAPFGKGGLEVIKWSKASLEREKYQLQIFPTNFLPSTPAGQLQTVSEMMDKGLLSTREEALALLDFPDLKQATSMATAAWDDANLRIELALNEGHYEPPDGVVNLELLIRLGHASLLRARVEGAPQKNLDMMMQMIDEAKILRDRAKATEAPPAAPPAPIAPPVMQPQAAQV